MMCEYSAEPSALALPPQPQRGDRASLLNTYSCSSMIRGSFIPQWQEAGQRIAPKKLVPIFGGKQIEPRFIRCLMVRLDSSESRLQNCNADL